MALENFRSLKTWHCVTGSMQHVYLYNHHDVSEDRCWGWGLEWGSSTGIRKRRIPPHCRKVGSIRLLVQRYLRGK